MVDDHIQRRQTYLCDSNLSRRQLLLGQGSKTTIESSLGDGLEDLSGVTLDNLLRNLVVVQKVVFFITEGGVVVESFESSVGLVLLLAGERRENSLSEIISSQKRAMN